MRFSIIHLSLLLPLLLLSCKGEKEAEIPLNEDDFFAGVEATLSLDSLKNEMAAGETEFLRSFADHKIAWQKWDKTLLEKAKNAQSPVFAFVGSSLAGSSQLVATEFNSNAEFRKSISQKAVCTVIDTNVHPEIATLGFFLNLEIKRTTSFPMLIWLSHEGAPLAWIPIGDVSGAQLEIVIANAVAMVEDIWDDSSLYAVENSRRDNEIRQVRFDMSTDEPEKIDSRNDFFRRETRQLSSLHSSGDNDIDFIGGLIPSGSLELLAIGSRSNLFPAEISERCRQACQSVIHGLLSGTVKDQLDGGYFFARRTTDWSLPTFSKSFSSQARLASMLFKVGSILDDAKITDEATNLLKLLETTWLTQNITSLSPYGDSDIPGGFLWDLGTLRKILEKAEFDLAQTAFSLNESGNIPIEVDPLGNYYRLNSLRNEVSIEKITEKHQLTEEEATASLTKIKAKLLDHRKKTLTLISESTMTIFDLAYLLQAQVDRYSQTRLDSDLTTAEATAERILKTYWTPEKGLLRIKTNDHTIAAHGTDYMATSLALIHLHQRSLDQRWLNAALEITNHAFDTLLEENGLIAENAPEERIIPLRQFQTSMIFGESTLGLGDQVANRLFALTGDKRFESQLIRHAKLLTPILNRAVINYTDFVTSCALGDTPLVAVLQGDPASSAGQDLHALLTLPKYHSFLTVRPTAGSPALLTLPDLPEPTGEASVILIRNNNTLGQASTPEKLAELLDSIISNK